LLEISAIVKDMNQKAQVEDARKSNEERSNACIDVSLYNITLSSPLNF